MPGAGAHDGRARQAEPCLDGCRLHAGRLRKPSRGGAPGTGPVWPDRSRLCGMTSTACSAARICQALAWPSSACLGSGQAAARSGLAVCVGGGDSAVAVRAGQHRDGDVAAGVVYEHDRRPAGTGRPLVAPGQQGRDDREQRPAIAGQVVLVPGRVLGVGAVPAPRQAATGGGNARRGREQLTAKGFLVMTDLKAFSGPIAPDASQKEG